MHIARLSQKMRRKSRAKNEYHCMSRAYSLMEKIKIETKNNLKVGAITTQLSQQVNATKIISYTGRIPFKNMQRSRC